MLENLEILEFEWAKLLKSVQILRLVSVLWWLLALLIAFAMSKDLIIALCLSTLCAVLFYRYLTNRLFARCDEIKNKLLSHFLEQNKAKFKPKSRILDFLNSNSPNKNSENSSLLKFIENAKTKNFIEFERFFLCDINFKNSANQAFLGILLILKDAKFKENLLLLNENELFKKLKDEEFNADKIYTNSEISTKFALVPNLVNPFFINLKFTLKENLILMQKNLTKIQDLLELSREI